MQPPDDTFWQLFRKKKILFLDMYMHIYIRETAFEGFLEPRLIPVNILDITS